MIKAIIFDCFGVLTTDTWKEFVGTLPEDQRQEASSLNRAYDSSQLSHEEFLVAIKDLTGRLPKFIEEQTANDAVKNHELLEFARELKTYYKIGLLSNIASNWITDTFLTREEQEIFNDLVMSHEVSLAKPDPRIFELAAERLGVEIEECLLVDDVEPYCMAARELGMQAIQYRDFQSLKTELEPILVASQSGK